MKIGLKLCMYNPFEKKNVSKILRFFVISCHYLENCYFFPCNTYFN